MLLARAPKLQAYVRELLAAIAAAVLAMLLFGVPTHMDEFLPYQAEACRHEAARALGQVDSCGAFLARVGAAEFERSSAYLGAASSVVIQPIIVISRSVLAHRLLGVAVLVAVGVGVARSMRLTPWASLVAMSAFPLALAIVRDTGPVRLMMLAIAWAPVLVRIAASSHRRWTRLLAAATLVLSLVAAVEDKPFNLFLIPGTVFWTIAAMYFSNDIGALTRRRGACLVLGFTALLVPVALLLAIQVPQGEGWAPYLLNLAGQRQSIARSRYSLLFGPMYALAWPSAAHRVLYVLDSVSNGTQPLALALLIASATGATALIGFSIATVARSPTVSHRASLLGLASSTAGLWAGALIARGWAVHHYAFMWIPLTAIVMAAISIQSPFRQRSLTIILALVTASAPALAAPLLLDARSESSRAIDPVMASALEAARDNDAVIAVASYGPFFTYRWLEGPRQSIVWTMSSRQTASLIETVRPVGRPLVHVCSFCDAAAVQRQYPTEAKINLIASREEWSSYLVQWPPSARR